MTDAYRFRAKYRNGADDDRRSFRTRATEQAPTDDELIEQFRAQLADPHIAEHKLLALVEFAGGSAEQFRRIRRRIPRTHHEQPTPTVAGIARRLDALDGGGSTKTTADPLAAYYAEVDTLAFLGGRT